MRKLLRYALSPILGAIWLLATLSTEPARAEPRDLIKQAYSLAERLDWDDCASGRRTSERAKQLLSQLETAFKSANATGDTGLALALDYAGEELADALDWYYEDCGGPLSNLIGDLVGAGFYYIPGTDTAIRIGGYVRTAIEISGEIGQLNRPNFGSALQLESGGNLLSSQFGYVTRKDDYQSFEVKGTIPLRTGHVNGLMVGYRFGTASNDSNLGALSTGGNDLNIYSPAGPGGGLGGGVSVGGGGGFADITNLRYADTYSEHLGYFGWLHDPCNIRATGASFTPYAKVIVGYVRESSSYSGTTAAGGITFGYSNQLDTWRGGVELGGHLKQPLGANFGLYGDAAVRFIYNKASIDSSLNFSGLVNATESGSASASKFDVGFAGGGGVYVQNGNATFSAGVAAESWQVPTVNYSFSAPVGVNFDDRWSVSAKLGLKIAF